MAFVGTEAASIVTAFQRLKPVGAKQLRIAAPVSFRIVQSVKGNEDPVPLGYVVSP